MRILLVEDSPINLKMYQEMLRLDGYAEVISARNGQEGLQKFNQDNFDVVISDLDMPLMNGPEMIALIRQSNKEIPIILWSIRINCQAVRNFKHNYPEVIILEKFPRSISGPHQIIEELSKIEQSLNHQP